MEHTNFLHVYTGDGKGKTTASIGLGIRAHGRGLRVCVYHFLKTRDSGEDIVMKKLGIPVHHYGIEGFFKPTKPPGKLKDIIKQGFRDAINTIKSGEFDLVILDEANYCFFAGLMPVDDFIKSIEDARCEIICTGRNAPDELIERADLVTEMKEIKHYFQKGIQAREGIEF